MTRLWIVRHGNTFAAGEPPRRIGARTDLPLVVSGRAQADALAAWFGAQGVRFGRVLTSPLARTREMATALAGATPVEEAPWLAEVDHGPDEDRPEPDVIARIGADALAAWDTRAVPPPGWQVDAPGKVAGWRALLAGSLPPDTLAVTSNGTARFVFAAAGLAPPAPLKLRTGAWGLLQREADGWQLIEWDRRP